MRRVILDGALTTPQAVHARLARDLDLPAHYGANLDALWDVLTTDIAGPVEIEWRDAERAQAALGPAFERFASLFRKVAARRDDFRFHIRP